MQSSQKCTITVKNLSFGGSACVVRFIPPTPVLLESEFIPIHLPQCSQSALTLGVGFGHNQNDKFDALWGSIFVLKKHGLVK